MRKGRSQWRRRIWKLGSYTESKEPIEEEDVEDRKV
jgi:hypothetical protein